MVEQIGAMNSRGDIVPLVRQQALGCKPKRDIIYTIHCKFPVVDLLPCGGYNKQYQKSESYSPINYDCTGSRTTEKLLHAY